VVKVESIASLAVKRSDVAQIVTTPRRGQPRM